MPQPSRQTSFAIEWIDAVTGFCRCPGAELHTNRNGRRDAIVHLDGAPTVFCFHTSCQAAVAETNRSLRRALSRGAQAAAYRAPSLAQVKARQAAEAEVERLRREAREGLPAILEDMAWTPAAMAYESPICLAGDPRNDWRLLLETLFAPDDTIWCGAVTDSCPNDADEGRKEDCRHHFRTLSEWLLESEAPGQFTCPSIFKNSIHSRSNTNVIKTPFLVVESDILTKAEIGGVFRWLSQFLSLRAVVDTAGKSLHGWFERPESDHERELRIMLPEMGCDPALFKLSQPCRLPGALREDRYQQLLYLKGDAH